MLRLTYLSVMGSAVGSLVGVASGHVDFWVIVGLGVGMLWHRGTRGDEDAAAGRASFFYHLFAMRRAVLEVCIPRATPAYASIACRPH